MAEAIKKEIFLENLKSNSKGIEWESTIGCSVRFKYGEIEDEVVIRKYEKNSKNLTIEYKDNLFEIKTTGFKRCALGNMLNVWTSMYKYDIGHSYGDIVVTDRYRDDRIEKGRNGLPYIRSEKRYKYKCLKCRYNGNMAEGCIAKEIGCACCANKVVVPGINDIPTTAPWMVRYFQGGYDEAKLYTKNCGKKLNFICPHCNSVKANKISINDLNVSKSIGCICGYGFSYPEKFTYNLLKQLGEDFKNQLTRTDFVWCNNYRYDFYIPRLNMIIETHGEQHYKGTNRGRSLQEEQENDRIKEELALKNGIEHYVVIDCSKSEIEYIKNNILNSKLVELLDLSSIDWLKCEEFALGSFSKSVCDYLKNNEYANYDELSSVFNISNATVKKYVDFGVKYGWCNDIVDSKKKRVAIYKDGEFLDEYESTMELQRQSELKYGVKINNTYISRVCNGKQESYKGYTFKYVNNQEGVA